MVTGMAGNFTDIKGGSLMCLISFAVVFIVCGWLMTLMILLKYFVRTLETRSEAKREATPSATPAMENSVSALCGVYDEEELAAVIIAAITAAGSPVNVIDVRPACTAAISAPAQSAWKMAARLDNNKGV